MKLFNPLYHAVITYLPKLILVAFVLLISLSSYYFYKAYQAERFNQAFANRTLMEHPLDHDNYLLAYSIGYLLSQQDELLQANKAFEVAEVSTEPALRAIVKFAIGNLHFKKMLADFGKERGSRRIVEQVVLAREAYKAALRLQPTMHDARYNLELLDRLSPEKRTQGFKTGAGYTYQITPQLQDGRMHMKDNTIRGLP
jgi:tetratricopeptide (TPR) repeat protein